MFRERLEEYYRHNRDLPPAILYYRDGVSEGQFNHVLDQEVTQILRACQEFERGYSPKLTVVICGKRHHTRFYPMEEQHADRNKNCVPGTVVDRGVTAIYDFDFYLQAHATIQGTAKSAHYYVIRDDIKFSADEIQGLTHNLCYLFGRATKGVSLVPPAYYADLACERGRCYIAELFNKSSPELRRDPTPQEVFDRAQKLWMGGPQASLKSVMWYI